MPTFTVGATFVLLEKYSARKFWNQVLHYHYAYCSERLASFKVPGCFEVCNALPHTSTGKVKKHVLRKTNGREQLPPAN